LQVVTAVITPSHLDGLTHTPLDTLGEATESSVLGTAANMEVVAMEEQQGAVVGDVYEVPGGKVGVGENASDLGAV